MDRAVFISAQVGIRRGGQVMHPHACAELYVSLEGVTIDVVNGQESKTLPLDVFVLTRDVLHGQINTTDYRYGIFKFDMDALIAALGEDANDESFQSIFVIEPAMRRTEGVSANMQIDADTAEYAEMTARILSSEGEGRLSDELFLSLVRLICKRARPRRGEPTTQADVIARTLLFINGNYSEEMTLDILAAHSGYSPRHLSRLFLASLGTSPMKYLMDVRLKRAAALLSENRLSVIEIADAVGIGDSSAFAKSFRSKFGMTPTEYKKRSMGL